MRFLLEKPIQTTEALNFDYTKPSPVAFVPLISSSLIPENDIISGKEIGPRVIPYNHKLQVTVSLTMPESDYNRKLGIFQVKVEFLSANGKVTSSSRNPCMLQFKSQILRFAEIIIKSISLITGQQSESQVLNIKMDEFTEGLEPTAFLKVTLEQRAEFQPGAGIPEIYAASLALESELPHLKRVIWDWRRTIFVCTSIMWFLMELMAILLFCRPMIIPRGRPRINVYGENISPSNFISWVKTVEVNSVKKPKIEASVVIRQSLRTRGMPPDSKGLGNNFCENSDKIPKSEKQWPRTLPLGSLSMSDAFCGDNMESNKLLIETVLSVKGMVQIENLDGSVGIEKSDTWLESMDLKPEDVARVLPTPSPATLVKFFPCSNMRMIAAGNTYGNIAFWNVDCDSENGDGDGNYLYRPHEAPISGISIQQHSLSKIFTSCYDGFLRVMDAEKEVFDLLHHSDDTIFCLSQQASNLRSLFFGEGLGVLNMLDIRTRKCSESWHLHEDRINTIDFNPQNPNIMATSSTDGTACIWDLRRMSKNKPPTLKTVSHSRVVTAAYFSPSGNSVATTSYDEKVGIISGINYGDISMIRHDNLTSRITSFRAIWGWDDSYIFVGNKKKGIDVISSSQRKIVLTLKSPNMSAIPCRFDAHPHQVGVLAAVTAGGACLEIKECKTTQLSSLSQCPLYLKFEKKWVQKGRAIVSGTFPYACYRPREFSAGKKRGFNHRPREFSAGKKQGVYPQNVDLPAELPKQKKKPFPIPFKEIKRAARKDKLLAERGIEKPLEPPQNGLLAPDLIPVAHEVLDAWKLLIKGLAQLLHVIPVYGCSECSEVHVAHTGHFIQECKGPTSKKRRGMHSWVKGSINDILITIESYHLYDPFGRRIKHETRFDYDRIPAVVELCIQAGVDIPEYPSRRRTEPIRMIGKKVIYRGGYVEEPKPWRAVDPSSSSIVDLDTCGACGRYPPPPLEDVPRIAQETMDAYEIVQWGVTKLMRKYTVKACGYCSEIHVGPWGHNAKLCGAFKHQWRDGKHGWQDATVAEVLPPNYVWHVRDPKGPPLRSALKRFYGKAPAVVEVCAQAGAQIPDRYKPMMRLDIIIPDSDEANLVA
ncbi:hypothetical protein CCACVL1_16492 [Corchorus capsularis]|uniref:APO domain-containing protein n=1 Tax=Corchorus capsularis TaxID=210143 RepID=A0A1R3HWJ3_COCAP|nr:hypothetical protein CCACVL1_16492 [Corchorus capsularis]